MAHKPTFVIRHRPQATVEDHPVVLSLELTDEQKELIQKVTGKAVKKLELSAIELNQVVDALAFGHGSTVGASY